VSDSTETKESSPEQALPRDTTPTWEMELLLSGAMVFGLLQAPAYLNQLTDPMFARLGSNFAPVARMLFMYFAAAVYALLATFVLHLLIRGAWIAAVGVRSMFPQGPDFTKLRGGQISRRVTVEAPPIGVAIDRLDNLATTCFALGAITAMGALMSALILVPVIASDLIAETWFGLRNSNWPFITIGVMLVPLGFAAAVDSLAGRRLPATHALARLTARIYRFYRTWFSPSVMTVLMNTLTTRLGFMRVMGIYMLALLALVAVVLAQMSSRIGNGVLGDYALLPIPRSGLVVQAYHYADQRGAQHAARLDPYIASMQPEGPWLRVYLPFDAGREGAQLVSDCPQLPAIDAASDTPDAAAIDAALGERLGCLAKIHDLRVDGQVPARVDYNVYVDADTGVRGVLAMLDVSTLASGRHVVGVHWHGTKRDVEKRRKRLNYNIPFWR